MFSWNDNPQILLDTLNNPFRLHVPLRAGQEHTKKTKRLTEVLTNREDFLGFVLSHSSIFHSYGDITIAGEGLNILNCARHSWPLSSECSVAFHTYCDTGHLFIMVISEDPSHSHLLLSDKQWNCHQLFLRLGYVADGIRTPNHPLAGKRLSPLSHHRGNRGGLQNRDVKAKVTRPTKTRMI